ncbi:MAG: hypothetical protein R3B45_08475 [Bdellovibrionota bacterium]
MQCNIEIEQEARIGRQDLQYSYTLDQKGYVFDIISADGVSLLATYKEGNAHIERIISYQGECH